LVDTIWRLTRRDFEAAENRARLIRILAELIDGDLSTASVKEPYDSAGKHRRRTEGFVQILRWPQNAFEGEIDLGSRS
jgi:hypothetical protein